MFNIRQIQEKCVKQNMKLYVAFIDFTTAFDTVSREGLWCLMKTLCCSDKIVNLTSSARLDKKLQIRKGKASAAFGKLQQRLWSNRHVSIRVKCKVHRAVVLSSLHYGAESWTISRAQLMNLHLFMMRQLRDIMSSKWYDKISNEKILQRANLPSMTSILTEKTLNWLGHVHGKENNRIPRQLLYSQVCNGKRNEGRPKVRFKDVTKRNMKQRNISATSW